MANRIFFTSDTHFGDPNVIRVHERPFGSIEEMDAALIANWNKVVDPDDTVYHLGDFGHRSCFDAGDYLDKLNGTIHLIRGNHDDVVVEVAGDKFASVELMTELDWQGRRLVLFHYPMRDWPNAVRGSFHLYGHVHGQLDHVPLGLSLDVGVDTHGFQPVAIEEAVAVLENRPKRSRGFSPAA